MPAPRPRIRAVLFDLGGTLVDERDFAGWAELARRVYLDLDADAVGHHYAEVERAMDEAAPPLEREAFVVEFWRRVLAGAADRAVDARTAAKFCAIVREQERPVHLFSDVRRCLDQLAAERRTLGVVSNSTSEASVRRTLDRVGILEYFGPVVSSGTEGVAKPDPEIFRRATKRAKVAPGDAFYVGNLAVTDARAAAAAGLHAAWLNRDGFGMGDDPPEIMSLLELPLAIRRAEQSG